MNTKRSVSLAIHHPRDPSRVLLVQRPADDDDLPGVWGLPAASLLPGEGWHEAVQRAARDKLGVEVTVGDVVEEGTKQRAAYTLAMRLYTARLGAGEPVVPQDTPGVTQYQAWRWGTVLDLQPAAECGSLCSQLYLRAQRRG
jgi:ADP-ribose pyrophosphatase YjhB (NUDIX family)